MITNKIKKRIFLIFSSIFIIIIIYLFPVKNIDYINNNKDNYTQSYIYLIDQNSYVSRVNFILSAEKDIDKIKEVIEYLTINSSKSSYIKDGFNQIIPENTKLLSVNLNNNIVTLNFSKEFLNINSENSNNLISSIIYSIINLNKDYKISIYVEGNILNKLPNNEHIDSLLDRTFGINKVYNLTSINGSCQTIIYYQSKINDYYYYVPITLVNNKDEDKIKIIIEEMASKTIYHTNLISYLKNIQKINYEQEQDTIILNLSTNNFVSDNLIEETIYTINLSLEDNYNNLKFIYYIDDKKYPI